MTRTPASAWLVIAAVTGAAWLGVILKPLHIDDALYVAVADQIRRDPFDPYGGLFNWQNIPEPLYRTSISPPLLSYYFAAARELFGESDLVLSLAIGPWLALLAWGLVRVGVRFAGNGFWPAMLVLSGPAVGVGTNRMLDVPMLAMMLASLEFAGRSLESPSYAGRWSWAFFAGLMAASGVLIKYPAVAMVAALATWALARRSGPLVLAMAIPSAALGGWLAVSRALYGASQVGQAMSFLDQFRANLFSLLVGRPITMFAILGMSFPLWLAVAWVGRRRALAIALAAGFTLAAGVALIQAGPTFGAAENRPLADDAFFLSATFLGALGWFGALIEAVGREPRARVWRDDVPLVVWLAASATIAVFLGPFVAARSFLPLQPALAIFFVRGAAGRPRAGAAFAATVGLSLLLSAALAWADSRWASFYPRVTGEIGRRHVDRGEPVYFLGHWGWQHYAAREGMHAWDARWQSVPPGGLVVIPRSVDKQYIEPAALAGYEIAEEWTLPPHPLGLSTWRRPGVRFYGGDFGETPWGFSVSPAEHIVLLRPTQGRASP